MAARAARATARGPPRGDASSGHAGRAGYLLTTLAELRRFENRRVELSVDGNSATRDVLLVAIANGAYYGGGMRIAPSALPDDGRLDVCLVGDVSRLTVLRQLPNLYRGTHVEHPAVEMRTGSLIEVDGDFRTRIHLDGEPFGELPLRVSLSHRVLAVAAVLGWPAERIRRAIEGGLGSRGATRRRARYRRR